VRKEDLIVIAGFAGVCGLLYYLFSRKPTTAQETKPETVTSKEDAISYQQKQSSFEQQIVNEARTTNKPVIAVCGVEKILTSSVTYYADIYTETATVIDIESYTDSFHYDFYEISIDKGWNHVVWSIPFTDSVQKLRHIIKWYGQVLHEFRTEVYKPEPEEEVYVIPVRRDRYVYAV